MERVTDHAVLIPKELEGLGFQVVRHERQVALLPPLCDVPAGEFVMGSDANQDKFAYSDEIPQHQVFTNAFSIGMYPVTVAEYAIAVDAGIVPEPPPYRGITWDKQRTASSCPVTSVSWIDALSYCVWLGEIVGKSGRLPTEAEWEKAVRGEDGRIYPWGNVWRPDLANTPDGGPGHYTPVWHYPEGAGPFGVQDGVGNVWEWCSSLYHPYPYDSVDGREALYLGGDRILRGGAWYCVPYNARTACRGIGFRGLYLGGGFRLVLGPKEIATTKRTADTSK